MILTQIKLMNFRNYTALSFAPSPGINVLIGQNAQGKTNILESIYLCCIGKSHRAKRDIEMIRRAPEVKAAYCGLQVSRRDGHRTVEVMLSADARKRIKVLGQPIARMSALMGHINCVFFSPEDLQLIKSGPSGRRKYLDVTLCQIRPAYYSALYQYNAALAQRNALLRRYTPNRVQELSALDEVLAAKGGRILVQRAEFTRRIQEQAGRIHAEIAAKERLQVGYHTQIDAQDEATAADQLYAQLEQRREEDLRRVVTTVGPHRDDMEILINEKEARAYASQGQQRTAVLALKLAALSMMRQETGELPILMLDDVLSELDDDRRTALLQNIEGQAFITAAVRPQERMTGAQMYLIHDGTLRAL